MTNQATNVKVQSMGLFDLVLNAGPMGKIVLVFLLAISVFCWAIIFSKYKTFKKIKEENKKFLDYFWQSKSVDEIYTHIDTYSASPVAHVFKSGIKELRKLTGQIEFSQIENENIARALQRASNDQIAEMESHISWLATTASAAPFIGLFGTVWGIMTSFQNIGASGAASLAVVAPGISEALIATAAGIGAAIPAAVFYNHFLNDIKKISIDLDNFNYDFLNIVRRSVLYSKPSNTNHEAQTHGV